MPRPYTAEQFRERFWQRVNKTDDCWYWTGACVPKGYGYLTRHGKNYTTHRVAYEFTYGPIPVGMCVLHHCDHPSCVRPDHLFLGTLIDNNADMLAKNRNYVFPPFVGERHGLAKLTEEDVRQIRQLYQRGVRGSGLQSLAKRFGVTKRTTHSLGITPSWMVGED